MAVYWTVPEAELARGMLVADGIPVAFLDGADAALLPGTAPVRLLVPTSDLERSRLLLGGPGPRRSPRSRCARPRLACSMPHGAGWCSR